MAITCHIFECNALHYNYVMRKKCPLQITFHYFENVIHYNYITITITITPGLLAGIEDMHKSLDEFEIQPDPTTGFHGNR